MKVFILGGDGFCGWPTALHLSRAGADVVIVDNLSRRQIDKELNIQSLTPIAEIGARLDCWNSSNLNPIRFQKLDLAKEPELFSELLKKEIPDAVIHFAEQRSAPYSMKTPQTGRYTVENNTLSTHNLLSTIVENKLNTHIIHLGTMGVYGYSTIGTKIPEGYLDVQVTTEDGNTHKRSILYPTDPGSIYHTTKTLDQLLFYFYNKNFGLQITDLHQGIVWGTDTPLTASDDILINRFDYDGDYGTVLNRFLMQAALRLPLTVHGKGGQQRAFIHIRDSIDCFELAIKTPPKDRDRVRIYNQATEVHSVIDLANAVAHLSGSKIEFIQNPRIESENNELSIENTGLKALGLDPTRLADGLMNEIISVATRYAYRVDKDRIPCKSFWRPA